MLQIPGQGVLSSQVLRGMIFRRTLNEGKVQNVEGAKVAVYTGVRLFSFFHLLPPVVLPTHTHAHHPSFSFLPNLRGSLPLGPPVYPHCVVRRGSGCVPALCGGARRERAPRLTRGALYVQAVDWQQTETKGTVLINSAAELKDFSRGEENMLEAQIAAIKSTGVNVVVSGSRFGDMAEHFLNKAGIMMVCPFYLSFLSFPSHFLSSSFLLSFGLFDNSAPLWHCGVVCRVALRSLWHPRLWL